MSQLPKLGLLVLLVTMTSGAFAEDTQNLSRGELSAAIGVVNKYIYRGGEENDDPSVQFGLEYAHNSGIFLDYWGSTLNYDSSDANQDHGFEHDFYIGYGRALNENWSYKSQIVSYYYQNGGTVYSEDGSDQRRTTGFEILNDVFYNDLSLGLDVMLTDVNYANTEDVYLSAAYSYPLPQNFNLNTSVGAFLYNASRDDQLIQTTENFSFNETQIGLSKTVAERIELSLDYVYGGKGCDDIDFDNHIVVGTNFNF